MYLDAIFIIIALKNCKKLPIKATNSVDEDLLNNI